MIHGNELTMKYETLIHQLTGGQFNCSVQIMFTFHIFYNLMNTNGKNISISEHERSTVFVSVIKKCTYKMVFFHCFFIYKFLVKRYAIMAEKR